MNFMFQVKNCSLNNIVFSQRLTMNLGVQRYTKRLVCRKENPRFFCQQNYQQGKVWLLKVLQGFARVFAKKTQP